MRAFSIYNNKEKLISPKFSKKKCFWQTNYYVNQSFDLSHKLSNNKSNTFSIQGEQGDISIKNKIKGDKNKY